MIKKQFRLSEREVKRVLQKGKPFFSYGIVMNFLPNKKAYNRYAIVIGKKSVNNNVTRNFFRRIFYKMIQDTEVIPIGWDIVFVVKRNNKFDKKDLNCIIEFKKDCQFLLKKINKFTK